MPIVERSLNYGRHIIARFLREIRPYQVVVDLGAGHGDDLLIAQAVFPLCEIVAVETFPPYIAELERAGITVQAANIERDVLPFADQSVDVVITNQILEHTKEIFWIFHEVSRILKVGGHWIIGVPNLASLHNRLLLLFGKQPTSLKNFSAHVRGFTKGDLLYGLSQAFPNGYVLSRFAGSNFYPFPPLIARSLAFLFPSLAWSIFFLLKKNKSYHSEFQDYPVYHRLETNFWLGQK